MRTSIMATGSFVESKLVQFYIYFLSVFSFPFEGNMHLPMCQSHPPIRMMTYLFSDCFPFRFPVVFRIEFKNLSLRFLQFYVCYLPQANETQMKRL